MKLKGKTNYSGGEARQRLAKFISNSIEGKEERELPYKPNEYDSYYWTVDMGNNWKLKFYEEDPFSFSIIHRYQGGANKFEEALAGWLEYKLGVERA